MTISLVTENSEQSVNNLALKTTLVNGHEPLILLIENDQRLSNTLQHYIQKNGYSVERKCHRDIIEQRVTRMQADMIILDIGFSDVVSLSLITQIRRHFSGPLVLLTSRDSEQEQLTAFNLGVDEYLVKPVSANIFSARIAALFRRAVKSKAVDESSKISVGNLTLYPFAHKCQLGQQTIVLTQFEFKLLRLLAENVGKIMSRDHIYQTLLGREYNGCERTVDVRVSQLREKLTSNDQRNICIETIWGQGYMLNTVD
ncbi:MAG: response regulator transcription factor [Colwellia sp.]|nr:response regulator transcription factor [Colwellia sp.]MCW8864296.1 response regulator transcription factor [Colwellia sp.]MCW9080554.1 response regulator transcription factor [Colwellia sp.]